MVTDTDVLRLAIPLAAGQVDGWKNIPIIDDAHNEPLVPLGPLSGVAGIITTSSIYFGEHTNSPYSQKAHTLQGSLLTLFARESVANRLLMAEQWLPAGHHLLVFDAYRPYQVQKSLHDFYKQSLRNIRTDMDDDALEIETQKYVSLPSTDASRPSPHNTGGAIDLAIIRLEPEYEEELQEIRAQLADDQLPAEEQAGLELRLSALVRHHSVMLDFGTAFDHGGEKSALTYYESKIADGESLTGAEMRACNNRRLLFSVMTRAGFQPYFAEWWHFNAPESQMGAASAGHKFATMGAAELDERNIRHEQKRLALRHEALRLQNSDITTGGIWPAEIIAPEK